MKNEMTETIQEHGINKTSELLAEYINQKITSEDIAMQFVLEELEAASQGNDIARLFAETSGFDEDDYLGAMKNSFEEIDGADGPQQALLNYCSMLFPDINLAVELRIKTVDIIMKHWQLGKYSSINYNEGLIDVVVKKENHPWGVFANIMNDLGVYSSEYGETDRQFNILRFMAYAYARRTAAAGLYLQGHWNREFYNYSSEFFRAAQLKTGQSVGFQERAAEQALELLFSYDERFTRVFVGAITSVVELNQVVCPYDIGVYYSDEEIFDFFCK